METNFTSWLSNKLKNNGWSMREFARRAKISHSSVSKVISGEVVPSWDFCAAISVPLNEPIWDVAQIAGLLPKKPGDMSYKELEDLITKLSVEQREEVIEYVKYLMWKGRG